MERAPPTYLLLGHLLVLLQALVVHVGVEHDDGEGQQMDRP
jgi:hypothetical protein